MSKSKKKKNNFRYLAMIFGVGILFCIVLLLIDKIKSNFSSREIETIVLILKLLSCIFVLIFIFMLYKKLHKKYSMKKLDSMSGSEFEYACAKILKRNGFKKVAVTQGSGDFGVDILAYKNGVKYAVQCKRYSRKLNNSAIQEVIGGLAFYDCEKGAVMTNQYFTEPAKALAEVNDIELWDRDILAKWILK